MIKVDKKKFILILKKFKIQDIDKNKNLITNAILDSMEIVNLIIEIEKKFKIKINDNFFLMKNFGSINSFLKLIKKKLNKTK